MGVGRTSPGSIFGHVGIMFPPVVKDEAVVRTDIQNQQKEDGRLDQLNLFSD